MSFLIVEEYKGFKIKRHEETYYVFEDVAKRVRSTTHTIENNNDLEDKIEEFLSKTDFGIDIELNSEAGFLGLESDSIKDLQRLIDLIVVKFDVLEIEGGD